MNNERIEVLKMSSTELLNSKLLEMGATKTQLSNKLIPMMLAIFADPENAKVLFDTFWDMKKELNNKEMSLYNREQAFEGKQREFKREISNDLEEINFLKRQLENAKAEIARCETAEARDKIRLAEYYKLEAEATKSYSPNVYLVGIGKILAGEDT